jgi:ATP diphosphatase
MNNLINLIKKLRNPVNGCPWDRKQTVDSIKGYIIEEAYELKEAIDKKSPISQQEEAGDLLLQIILLSRMNEEEGHFSFNDVVNTIINKIITRHPHIFGDKMCLNEEDVKIQWEQIKKKKKVNRSIISDYPREMPALLTAKRIGEQAASIGFDWDSPEASLAKVFEEISELKHELNQPASDKIEEELGDLLLAVANVSRKLNINPENALIKANHKFTKRFRIMEQYLEQEPHDSFTINELEAFWNRAKEELKENS